MLYIWLKLYREWWPPYQSPEKIRHAQAVYSVDHRRLGFFDGEVRPGEAVLKQFTVRAPSRRFYMSHGQRHRPQVAPIDEIFSEILEGYVLDSSYEIYVPVEIRY